MIVGELLVMACKHETIAHEGSLAGARLPQILLKKGKNMLPKGTKIVKVPHTVMSDRNCKKCKASLKQNLVMKKPNALLCYKCHKASD